MRPGPARLTVLSAIVVASIAGHAAAQPLYRWVDEKGVVHYSQFPPPAPAEPPTPAPEAKPSPAPEAKPAPAPQAKPSPAPEAKPSPVPGAKPSLVPGAKPTPAPEAKPSRAAPLRPRHERAIRELVHMAAGSGVTDAMFQPVAQALVPGLKPGLERQLKRPVSPEEEQKLVDVIRRTFVGVFPSALFEKELIEVYAKHFNEAEAEELLRFYRTPVGTKAIQLSAVLAGEGAVIGQRLAKSREAEFAQRLREELAREFSP